MNRSESIHKIAPALVEAQKHIGAAEKSADNPFFKSRYADLGSVMAVCKSPLLANGISVIQAIDTDHEDLILETILLHDSGEYISSRMRIEAPKRFVLPKGNEQFQPYFTPDPQAVGSAITYARRYALQALVFIPSVDDDAEWAAAALRHKPKSIKRSQGEIESLLEKYRTESATATPERVKELVVLINGLNAEIQDHQEAFESAPQKNQSPEEGTVTNSKNTPASAPGAPPEPEKPAGKVETPKTTRKPATRQEKAQVPDTLDTDQLPGIETPAVPAGSRWQDYRLKMKLPQYEGRLLSDLTFDELESIKESWVDKHFHKPEWPTEKRTEATHILAAFNARLEEKLAKK